MSIHFKNVCREEREICVVDIGISISEISEDQFAMQNFLCKMLRWGLKVEFFVKTVSFQCQWSVIFPKRIISLNEIIFFENDSQNVSNNLKNINSIQINLASWTNTLVISSFYKDP